MRTQKQQGTVLASSPPLGKAMALATLAVASVGAGGVVVAIGIQSQVFFHILTGILPIGAGGYAGWEAYTLFQRWRTFDTSYLRLRQAPVPLSGRLRAELLLPFPADAQPPDGFEVRVACHRESDESKVLMWSEKTHVQGTPGMEETKASISFGLPAHPIPDVLKKSLDEEWSTWGASGTYKDTLEQLDWTLSVTAERPRGLDYEASFDLPVTVPDDLDDRGEVHRDADEAPPSAPSDEDADEAFWTVEDEGADADLHHAREGASSPDDAEEPQSRSFSDGIHVEARPDEGLTVVAEHARPNVKRNGKGWAMLAAIFLPLGVGLLGLILINAQNVSASASGELLFFVLFGLLSTLGGGIALQASWTALTHEATIRVTNEHIEIQKGPFFLEQQPLRIPHGEVDEIQVERTAGRGQNKKYKLSLVEHGIEAPLPMLDYIPDKKEAEWIADHILQVVEQQAAPA